jgi:hypothetical protein
VIRLVVEFDPANLSPREARQAFAEALRYAVGKGQLTGDIDPAIGEELWRCIPDPELA